VAFAAAVALESKPLPYAPNTISIASPSPSLFDTGPSPRGEQAVASSFDTRLLNEEHAHSVEATAATTAAAAAAARPPGKKFSYDKVFNGAGARTGTDACAHSGADLNDVLAHPGADASAHSGTDAYAHSGANFNDVLANPGADASAHSDTDACAYSGAGFNDVLAHSTAPTSTNDVLAHSTAPTSTNDVLAHSMAPTSTTPAPTPAPAPLLRPT
jgi:hypothetical protein